MAQKLPQRLREVGSKLENPPASKDALIKLLKQAANCLSELDQSPLPSMLDSMQPCLNAIAKPDLLRHQDKDVRVLVAMCVCEITRITAPEAPYSDDVLRDIFHLIVGTFSGLGDIHSPSFGKRVVILETLARYRSCLVMLDLECNDLLNEMFKTFFAQVSDEHAESVLTSMQTIMVLILDESEDIPENLLFTILSTLGRKTDVSMAARKLAMNIIERCAVKLEPYVKQFLVSSMSGDNSSLNMSLDYHEIVYDTYRCAPQILNGIIPYITGELLTDQLDVRLKAVKLLGDLFSLPDHSVSESFRPLFTEFLKRLADRVVEVRILVIEHVKNCLISNPSRPEASEIISALCDRLLDYDENVRKQVVAAIYDVTCHELTSISSQTTKLVAERLRDKSLSVKKYTMERLAEVYKLYCLRSYDGSVNAEEFEWIPGKILRCLYDKDFRSETIESILCGALFPPEFTTKDKVKHWIAVITGFDKVEVKALEQVLAQKQRIQQEMQSYLALRQTYQDSHAPELYKRLSGSFRNMPRLFGDPAKAEESFQILNQLKDANIWKILTNLLDPCTSFRQAWTARDDLLRILGEKHPLYDFMGALSMRCSYLLFNKEYIKEILSEAVAQQSVGDRKFVSSCMNLLAILASFCPVLLAGFEEDLVHLLKEDNDTVKEGIAHILAKAGGTIREQLTKASSSVDLLLEGLCLEGTRGQAKYSVQALAVITIDDGLKSLSVLYKRLVDMLEKKTHLPAILQSLGYIAQTALPVFETREDEIIEFIKHKVLECSSSNKTADNSKHMNDWNERSELCLLKIFGIKTLVKSYLPVKDPHLRLGIENLLGILKNILSFGEISKAIMSSTVDKAHLRLASAKAILRLSRLWDSKIPVDIFYLALRTSEDIYPQCRKLFLSKIHQYIKERLLDPKYACAFLFNIAKSELPMSTEDQQNLVEIVQVCNQVKARQLSMQSDLNSLTSYPEYILVYLVHALAHHSAFPNINDYEDVEPFEKIYWRLHLFLSVLLQGDDTLKSVAYTDKTKENICTVVSIFQCIKCSEDVVDREKSKNSHAVCDIGMSIIRHLCHDQIDIAAVTKSVPLPEQIYRSLEKADDNSVGGEVQTWMCRDKVLAYFDSLDLERRERVDTDVSKDDKVSRESDEDDTELPIGKIMKTLKSQGAKKRKMKKQSVHSGAERVDNDFDVLGMVREINLDNQERTQSMEINKINQNEYHLNEWAKETDRNFVVSWKKENNNDEGPASISIPKKKRSPVLPKSQSRGAKGCRRSKKVPAQNSELDDDIDHSRLKFSLEEDKVEPTDSGLLMSCFPASKSSSPAKKGSLRRSNGTSVKQAINDDLQKSTKPVESGKSSFFKSTSQSIRKHKRRSIAVLEKCSLQKLEKDDTELVGCRIKVWWPLDKRFYEGTVQSHDPGKKKHVILYDDGDMEVLKLNKEKWELINTVDMAKKRLKFRHPPFEELPRENSSESPEHVSKRKRNSVRKATPRNRRDKQRMVSVSKIDADSFDSGDSDNSHLSNAHHRSGSEVDDGNSVGEQEQPSEPESNTVPMEVLNELGGEKQDSSCKDGSEDSDNEPLCVWRQRAGQVG
uniref:Sister chromatid cohesion protein PDS5 B n=1 Tax=Anthurium amnicola TaxID=1678845 RepID=A0A1D1Z6W4_9ARAE